MENYEIDKFKNEEKSNAIIKCIKKACDIMHIVNKIEIKAKNVRDAIKMDNKEQMWQVLQSYLKIYKDFINSLTVFTNIKAYIVSIDFYKNCTIEDIKEQLETVIVFIYLKEALNSKVKDSFKNLIKKLLRQTGLFSDIELQMIL